MLRLLFEHSSILALHTFRGRGQTCDGKCIAVRRDCNAVLADGLSCLISNSKLSCDVPHLAFELLLVISCLRFLLRLSIAHHGSTHERSTSLTGCNQFGLFSDGGIVFCSLRNSCISLSAFACSPFFR